MKNAIKLIVIGAILLSYQKSKAQSSFSISTGYSNAAIVSKNSEIDVSDYQKSIGGLNLGVFYKTTLKNPLSLEIGLQLTQKGERTEFNEDFIESTSKVRLLYLDIPVHFNYSFNLSEKSRLFIGAGSYLGIGLAGNAETTTDFLGNKETESFKVDWGRTNDNPMTDPIKRLDLGLTFQLGYQFKSYQLRASYQLGLRDIDNIEEFDMSSRTRTLSVSLGYVLN